MLIIKPDKLIPACIPFLPLHPSFSMLSLITFQSVVLDIIIFNFYTAAAANQHPSHLKTVGSIAFS